jgi:hypothetical protein
MEPEAIQRVRIGVESYDVLETCTRDEIAVLLAEYDRLRAIEAAARDYAEVYHFGGLAESTTRYGKLLAALAAKETP